MPIRIRGARENNLQNIDVILPDGLTVISGVRGIHRTLLALLVMGRRRLALDHRRLPLASHFRGWGVAAVEHNLAPCGPSRALGQHLDCERAD